MKLEITAKIADGAGIVIGRSVILFGRPRCAIGFVGNAIAFAILEPKTMDDARVLVYTPSELKEFLDAGDLKGTVECK